MPREGVAFLKKTKSRLGLMEFSAPHDKVAGTPNCPQGPRDLLSNGKPSLRALEANTEHMAGSSPPDDILP